MADGHDPGGRSKPRWRPGATITARFSDCGCYRYELHETWDTNRPAVMWLMMNPSVAGVEHSDPTIMKCGAFARAWGYGSQFIGNVHAYRITDSRLLAGIEDPVGPENDAALLSMAGRAAIVVLAYGQPPKPLRARGARVVEMIRKSGASLTYLRLCQDGTPQHPLYLPGDLLPLEYP